MRNSQGATAVAAYSTRAKPTAPVSVPLAWDELTESIHSDSFTVENLPQRLSSLTADPWATYFKTTQRITEKMLRVFPINP